MKPPKDAGPGPSARAPSWLLPAALAAVTFLVFSPSLRAGFLNWDDDKNFLLNPLYRGFSASHLRWMFTTFYEGMYQPFFWLSAALDYALWGMNALGYHLTNVLLHTLNAVLFYALSLRLLRAGDANRHSENELCWGAAAAALVFAVHPLRVESVAWLTERKDVLSGAFYLAAVLCYLNACSHERSAERVKRLALCLGFFAAALLSKASGIGLPFVLLALDVYPLKRLPSSPSRWTGPQVRSIFVEKIPFFALSTAAGLAGLASKHQALFGTAQFTPAQRLAQACYGLTYYLAKTLVPLHLYPLHEVSAGFDPFSGIYLLSGLCVLLGAAVVFATRERLPGLIPAAVTYLAFLAPVLGIVKWNLEFVAGRYSYLACAGWAVLAGWLFLQGLSSGPSFKAATRTLSALLLAAAAFLTVRQIGHWRDSEALWRYELSLAPATPLAQYDMADTLFDQGRVAESIPHYEQALQLKPDYFDAVYNLGNAYYKAGRLDAAEKELETAVNMNPGFAAAWNNLGNVQQDLGLAAQAVASYTQAIRDQPDYAEAYFNMGNTFYKARRYEQAVACYEQALRLRPDLSVAASNRAATLRASGKKL